MTGRCASFQAARADPGRPAALASLPDVLTLDTIGLPGGHAPEDPAETVTAQASLAWAVSTLSQAEHEAWHLMYVEDRPLAEVAELTGVPEGTVKSRAHGARRLLRAAPGRSASWPSASSR